MNEQICFAFKKIVKNKNRAQEEKIYLRIE